MHFHLLTDYVSMLVGLELYSHYSSHSTLTRMQKYWYACAVVLGALIGSRALAIVADPTLLHSISFVTIMANKTIIGAIVGAIVGVEIIKKILGVTERTGDNVVLPLMVALIIGRIGCQVAGVADGTIGGPCDWPWCFAQGDGIPRHPLPLYEITLLVSLLPVVYYAYIQKWFEQGTLFRLFMMFYFATRFCFEFLKEGQFTLLRLTVIQWVCLVVVTVYLYDVASRSPLMRRATQ